MAGVDRPFREMQQEAWEIAERSGFHAARWKELGGWKAETWCALMLVVSELAEAAEELRDVKWASEMNVREGGKGKPEGFVVEMADAVIRLMDLAGEIGVDLGEVVEMKMTYNRTRPYMHGRGM